jgi:hypothetical protein
MGLFLGLWKSIFSSNLFHKNMSAEDFAIKDYELKIRQMAEHLGRMWTRFNYMLGIQLAIAGGKFLGSNDAKGYEGEIILTGLVVALAWYLLGAQDRFLFDLYRDQVKSAFHNLAFGEGENQWKPGGSHVGQVNGAAEYRSVETDLLCWRSKAISSTKFAALFPLIVAALWMAMWLFPRICAICSGAGS